MKAKDLLKNRKEKLLEYVYEYIDDKIGMLILDQGLSDDATTTDDTDDVNESTLIEYYEMIRDEFFRHYGDIVESIENVIEMEDDVRYLSKDRLINTLETLFEIKDNPKYSNIEINDMFVRLALRKPDINYLIRISQDEDFFEEYYRWAVHPILSKYVDQFCRYCNARDLRILRRCHYAGLNVEELYEYIGNVLENDEHTKLEEFLRRSDAKQIINEMKQRGLSDLDIVKRIISE